MILMGKPMLQCFFVCVCFKMFVLVEQSGLFICLVYAVHNCVFPAVIVIRVHQATSLCVTTSIACPAFLIPSIMPVAKSGARGKAKATPKPAAAKRSRASSAIDVADEADTTPVSV